MADQPIELALQAMRLALQSISGYSDCLHDEGNGSPAQCQCPIHVARRALSTEQATDWRFVSFMDYRRQTNPRENDIVEAWKAYLRQERGTGHDADRIMSQVIGDAPSVRDWFVATSVIQWLATNCGMSVLERAGFRYDWERTRR